MGKVSKARKRLATYYTNLAKTESEKGVEGYQRLDLDRVQIIDLVGQCELDQNWDGVMGLVWAVENYLSIQGHTTNRVAMLETGFKVAKQAEHPYNQGAFMGNLGNAYRDLGQVEKAIDYYEQALTISREIGHRQGEGSHFGNLGNAYRSLGQVEKAIDYYEQALTISREIGHRQGEGSHLGNLGNAYRSLGQVEKAREYLSQSLAIFEAIKSPNAELVRKWLAELDNPPTPAKPTNHLKDGSNLSSKKANKA